MPSILRNRKHQVRPLTRAVVVLLMFGCWATISSFSSVMKTRDTEYYITGRKLLTEGTNDSVVTEEDTTEEVEVATVVEILPGDPIGCIKPAIDQFPDPVIHQKGRRRGGVIIHIMVATYMFIGLAIVCDDYFVPALTRVSDAMNLSPDVAGATFMAAGSSAPELATSVIGVFVAKDDIGVSGVVGSAVFNITLVIGLCALSATQPITLNWYSLCRDCFCYLISIIILICTIANRVVSWPEATFFLVMYVLYCVAMAFNSQFEAWAVKNLPVPDSWRSAGGHQGENINEVKEMETSVAADGTSEVKLTPEEGTKEIKDDEFEDPLKKPLVLDDGRWAVFSWYVCLPLTFLTVYTVPDCRKKKYSRMFVLSFFCSVFWICLYSYIMVWMITIIGFTFGIPDTVMGLTLIAAGVSVPDALSGIAVVKEGHGDMAVSNAIGSNVFDILVCLGIPWFLQTAVKEPGSEVLVMHKGILYSTFTLFSTVVFLIGASHVNGWKMDRKYGIILIIWYVVVIIFASLYETNILGHFNPSECSSEYERQE